MHYRERYLVTQENRNEASNWAHSAANHYGLLYYTAENAIRVEASSDLWVMNPSGRSPVHEEYVLSFNFSRLVEWKNDEYLRRIEFSVAGEKIEWTVSESAGEPPLSLEDFLEAVPPKMREKAEEGPVFYEMYAGIYSRLFPVLEHGSLHTAAGEYEE
jgi:hypothetical protein